MQLGRHGQTRIGGADEGVRGCRDCVVRLASYAPQWPDGRETAAGLLVVSRRKLSGNLPRAITGGVDRKDGDRRRRSRRVGLLARGCARGLHGRPSGSHAAAQRSAPIARHLRVVVCDIAPQPPQNKVNRSIARSIAQQGNREINSSQDQKINRARAILKSLLLISSEARRPGNQ